MKFNFINIGKGIIFSTAALLFLSCGLFAITPELNFSNAWDHGF